MYEKLVKHYREYDIKSFGNFAWLCLLETYKYISRSSGAKNTPIIHNKDTKLRVPEEAHMIPFECLSNENTYTPSDDKNTC